MNIKSFRKPPVKDPSMAVTVAAIDDYLRQLTQNPILGSRIVRRVSITTSNVDVAHGLGSPWQGWLVIRKDANINIWETGTQTDSKTYLSLTGSGSGTVDLYIF